MTGGVNSGSSAAKVTRAVSPAGQPSQVTPTVARVRFSVFDTSGETDLSWQLVLHDAWATGVHFGEQIIFTYGPYGFAYCGYDPRTFAVGLAIWLLIAAITSRVTIATTVAIAV